MEGMNDYEKRGCLHDLFKVQAKRSPEKIAVMYGEQSITYGELDRRTDTLAQKLRDLGAKADATVGIYMEKCLEYVVSYVAILKAGAAYMPLDVTYPSHLLLDIFEDARPVCVLTNDKWHKRLIDSGGDEEKVISLSNDWETKLSTNKLENVSTNPVQTELDNLAYVCYSSGTTGKPKGIMCPHRGAVFSYTWRHLAYPFEEGERVACNVFFVWEMLRPLLKGVTMYIIPDNVIYDPRLLAQFFKTNSITRVLFTPSLLETVLDTEGIDLEDFASLKVIWFCGEVVTMSLLWRCTKSLPWIRFLNLYSVSECHDVAAADLTQYCKEIASDENGSSANLKKRKFAPVGKVLPGVNIFILDENYVEQPAGVPGEIYVGGPTLARGYLNRPELNSKRFIEWDQKGVKTRLYRTGDWGLLLANRDLEICGRCDSMVKIRGYSVETQAVEAALLQISKVNACVVLAEGEEGTDKQLVAYVVPQSGATKRGIRTELKQKLPTYMIPSYIIFLKKIPMLAATGKLDKKALPSINGDKDISDGNSNELIDDDESGLPKTETERTMSKLWSDILQFPVTDVEESFFDLGGHSLLAARLLGKIREVHGIDIEVQALFAHPTITELSAMIDARKNNDISVMTKRRINLRNEVSLNAIPNVNLDIQLRAFWRSANYGHRWHRGRVLLTGATGFLGAYVLRDLLTQTKTQIYCLVRENRETGGKERLRNTMKFYEFFSNGDERVEEDFENRVHAIKGDVALLELGMDEEDYAHLSHDVDFVIHAAAYVNLVYPFEALKGANVHGTRNVLHFCTVGKVKALHYVSTNAVFPNNEVKCKEASSEAFADNLDNGYAQTKWVAEQLVMRAIKNGLPAAIYRLGNACGDRHKAGWNPADFILLVLRASMAAGVWPDIDWKIEMTPVDFISKSIVQLSQHFSTSMHKIFHIVNANEVTSSELHKMVSDQGYDLAKVSFDEWCDAVAGTSEEFSAAGHPSPKRMLATVTKARDPSLLSFNTTFDQTLFDEVRKTILKEEYPVITKKLVGLYLKNLGRRDVIPKNIRRAGNVLRGKVALITGASSGIGQAVSEHLAQAGATVCLAARREEKLKSIQEGIVRKGGDARVYSLDVSDRQQFKQVAESIEETLGHIDILVNNAGLMYYTHIHNFMEDDWDRMINVNCRGVTNGIGAVLPEMLSRQSGHIVNTSSDAGRRGFPGLAVYSGTKFFVEGLSQALRHEVKGKGIRVTCIQPGDVKTELLTHTRDQEAKDCYDGSETCEILDPEDIGKAVVYAVTQAGHVGVNEILIEPRENPI